MTSWPTAMTWTLGLLLLAGGCTDKPQKLILPGDSDIVNAFPQDEGRDDAPKAVPLEVTMSEPTGAIYNTPTINVSFNQALVTPTDQPTPAMKIEPAIQGTWRWLGDRTLSFRPEERLPMATEYRVTVPQGLASAQGTKLDADHTFSFHTPRLRVNRYDPSWYNARLRKDDAIFVQFTLPVSLKDATSAISLTAGRVQVPVTLKATDKDKGGDKVPEGTAFLIKPRDGFQIGQEYTVRVASALKPSQGGTLTLKTDWVRNFKTYQPFAVNEVRCGWGRCEPNHSWTIQFNNPVDADDIKKCLRVTPRVNIDKVYSYRGSTRVTVRPSKVRPGQRYTVSLGTNCVDDMGNKLTAPKTVAINVAHYSPSIIMNRGVNFMEAPRKPGDRPRMPITLRNTPDLRLRMLRLTEETLPAFLNHFNGWSNRDTFRDQWKPTVDRAFNVRLTQDVKKTYSVELSEVLGKDTSGIVALDLRSKAYDERYGYGKDGRHHKSLVQVTDIGMTAKYSPTSVLIWTTSLADTTPLAGVRVAMRAVDGELLWEGKSDADGIARGPGLKTFGTKKPRIILATRGKELSFIDLENWDMQSRPYRYDLPYDWDAPAVSLRGHIFTERGVYRPGEAVHVKGYLRIDKGRKLELLPVNEADITITDSTDEIVFNERVSLTDLDGFDVKLPVKESAPLGRWYITARPVGMDGGVEGEVNGSFRVEAYRAPDFEVSVGADQGQLIVGEQAAMTISGQYLFGAPMGNAKVNWSASRVGTSFKPAGFDGFAFGKRARLSWWDDHSHRQSFINNGQGKLDAAGLNHVEFEIPPDDAVTGPQQLVVEASVTDINRQVVSSTTRIPVHPGAFYVGVHRDAYLLEVNKPTDFKFVAVTPSGDAVAGRQLQVELQQRTWRSVRKAMAGGGLTWVTETEDKTVATCRVTTGRAARGCTMTPKKTGYYIVRATSKDDAGRAIETTTSFYAYGGGWSWWGGQDDERINLVADKQSYAVGDKARVMVKSPFKEARAMITVERRGILSQRTVMLRGSANTIEVPITEEMLPNAYLSVVLVRGRDDSLKGDDTVRDAGKPAFKMGYVALNIDRSSRQLKVGVEPTRKTWRPGETAEATITLADHTGQPVAGEVTFMAVDEGVLSLTAYQTPKPGRSFYAAQPIAVISGDSRMALVDKVEGAAEEGDKGDEGGGGGPGGGSENYRAAFATTAAFMPTIKVSASGTTKVTFKLPDNLTAFRLMAVAVASNQRFGSNEARIQVQKPLMVRPALARFGATGDRLELRAVVQNIGELAGMVEVSAEADGPVELTGVTTARLNLGPRQMEEVAFPAVFGAPGEAKVRFVARAVEGFEASDAVEMKLPVRFPAAERTLAETGRVTGPKGERAELFKRLSLPDDVRSDVGGLTIELTSSAIQDLLPGLQYLVGYPYGCVEQTTGRTLPLVAMRGLLGEVPLPGISEEDVQTFAQAGIDRLFSMQTYEGGLGYWPGADQPHPWGSAYGGLALIRASQIEGLKVNPNKLDNLLNYLRSTLRGDAQMADHWHPDALINIQAFAAYTLAEADQPEPAYTSVLFKRRQELSKFGKGLLAMAILRGGQDKTMARSLLAEMMVGAQIDGAEAYLTRDDGARTYSELMDSDVRSNAIALMATSMARPSDDLVAKFARGLLSSRRNGRWLSTQENAFAVLALMKHVHQTEGDKPDFTALVGLGEDVVKTERFKGRDYRAREIFIPMETLLKHKDPIVGLVRQAGQGPLYYSLKLSYAPATAPTDPLDNGFTLRREFIAADGPDAGQPVQSVKPGQLVKIKVTLVAPLPRRYVAINVPLPSGLEPVNTSFATTAPSLRAQLQEDNGPEGDWAWRYDNHQFDHIETRDDRLLFFADMMDEGVYSHTVLARATTPGNFTAPAATIEAMYDPNVHGRTEAFKFEIR